MAVDHGAIDPIIRQIEELLDEVHRIRWAFDSRDERQSRVDELHRSLVWAVSDLRMFILKGCEEVK